MKHRIKEALGDMEISIEKVEFLIKDLQDLVAKHPNHSIEIENTGYDYYYNIVGSRLETDEEYQLRLQAEATEKAKKEAKRLAREAKKNKSTTDRIKELEQELNRLRNATEENCR